MNLTINLTPSIGAVRPDKGGKKRQFTFLLIDVDSN